MRERRCRFEEGERRREEWATPPPVPRSAVRFHCGEGPAATEILRALYTLDIRRHVIGIMERAGALLAKLPSGFGVFQRHGFQHQRGDEAPFLAWSEAGGFTVKITVRFFRFITAEISLCCKRPPIIFFARERRNRPGGFVRTLVRLRHKFSVLQTQCQRHETGP